MKLNSSKFNFVASSKFHSPLYDNVICGVRNIAHELELVNLDGRNQIPIVKILINFS